MQIIFKEIEIKDADIITSLIEQLGYKSTKAETIKRIENIIKREDHFSRTAVLDNKIVGWIHAFVSLHLESNPYVEIGGLVVDEKFRGRGIGQKLIAEVEQWTTEKKLNHLKVRSNVIRKETHRFYLARGFQFTKEQKIFDKQID